MKKYIIAPGCSDLNRGDQALVWETKKIGESAGFIGKYYLISEKNEPVIQSKREGLSIISPLLEHPSRKYKDKANIKYTKTLKIKWGLVAMFDLIESLLILNNITRPLIKKFISKDKQNSLNIFSESDAVFMKGGGLLQTYGGLSSTYSMYFWVYPLLLAHKMKKDVYIMPNSFGPFDGPFVKTIAKNALKKCRVVTTRETISQKMLLEILGIKANNYADLAFGLEKSNISKKEIFEKYSIPSDKKIVALTMRPYRFPKSEHPEESYEFFKSELTKFIKWLNKNDFVPVLIEHTLAVNDHENDGACIKEIAKMLNKNEFIILSNDNYNCRDLKCIYSFFDYIIGTRFHSMIFSFGCNIPGIAISYTGNKSVGIMHDMDLDDYVIDIYDVKSETLVEKFEKLLKNEKEVSKKISEYRNIAENDRQRLINECRGE